MQINELCTQHTFQKTKIKIFLLDPAQLVEIESDEKKKKYQVSLLLGNCEKK